MLLIHTKCYKLAEKPLTMLFRFNISVPSPLFKKSYTSHSHLFIIMYSFMCYIMIHLLM